MLDRDAKFSGEVLDSLTSSGIELVRTSVRSPCQNGVPERWVGSARPECFDHKACRDGYSAFFTRAAALFRDLALARADGSLRNFLLRPSKIDVLVIDDWAMTPLSETEARDFWETCEDRCQTRSLELTSQMPVAKWHNHIGDSTLADGILDRIVHRAHRIELRGESMRKNPPKQPER